MHSHSERNEPDEGFTAGQKADIGVLLVHGIGDHQEGQTLTAFGEPLMEWLEHWSLGVGDSRRFQMEVGETRLQANGSPAYTIVDVSKQDLPSVEQPNRCEKLLVCEGWWGGVVQAPHSLQLLLWMWLRGPLVIYWHFNGLCGAISRSETGPDTNPRTNPENPSKEAAPQKDVSTGEANKTTAPKQGRVDDVHLPSPSAILRGFGYAALAFVLASTSQIVTSLAILLWIIPFGPWRAAIVSVVRTMTLSLGDCYVLERPIQHAAIVERVRNSLDWLAGRAKRVVVVAHSQGCSIAHEALKRLGPDKCDAIKSFVTVGSGLEKLAFLREVRRSPNGLYSTFLILPFLCLTLAIYASSFNAEGWRRFVPIAPAALLLIAILYTASALAKHQKHIEKIQQEFKLTERLKAIRWLDLFATDDPVPMGRGSMLRALSTPSTSTSDNGPCFEQVEICNERFLLTDHVTYFKNYNDCAHRIWQEIARCSGLSLFSETDHERLLQFSKAHDRQARMARLHRLACGIAAVVLFILLGKPLQGFGQSVVDGIKGSAVENWFKVVDTGVDVVFGIARFVFNTKLENNSKSYLTAMFYGSALLLIGISVWWMIYRGFSNWSRERLWRAAAKGENIESSPISTAVFALITLTPLLFCVLISRRPDIFTLNTFYQLLAATMGCVLHGLALVFAVVGPQAVVDKYRELRATKDAAGHGSGTSGEKTLGQKLQEGGEKLKQVSEYYYNLVFTVLFAAGMPLWLMGAGWAVWPTSVVPVVGGLTTFVVVLTALGAWLRVLWLWLKKRKADATSACATVSQSG
jgi:hypothetical protein